MSISATASPEDYLRMLGNWPTAVGRFVLAFSSCEYWTYIFLQQLGSPALRGEMANARLNLRISRIDSLAVAHNLPAAVLARLRSNLGALRRLSDQRNLAAHNAPMAHVFQHAETGELSIRWEVRGANNPDVLVTREALEQWLTAAVSLDNALAAISGELSQALA